MGTELYKVQVTKDAVVGDGMVAVAISRTDGKKGKSGHCIVIPDVSDAALSVISNDVQCQDWLRYAINQFKSQIASAINKNKLTITSDKLGTAAVLSAMRAETESQRMTKEAIGEWFTAELAPLVAARIQDKLPGIAADKLAKLVESYCTKFQMLAGRDVSMSDTLRAQLLVALELLPEDTDNVMTGKVAAKLAEVSEASEVLEAL